MLTEIINAGDVSVDAEEDAVPAEDAQGGAMGDADELLDWFSQQFSHMADEGEDEGAHDEAATEHMRAEIA